MAKRVCATLVVTVLALGTIGAQQPSGQPSSDRRPLVIPAVHHDISAPLRAMSPRVDAPQGQREAREPGPLRRSRRSSNLRVDTVVQDYPSAPVIPLPTLNFEGVANVNGVLPPDANGDVGSNHYVQWVNLSFAIFSKGSATTPPALLYGPAAGNTLWTGFGGPCETRNDGDPVVIYDHLADRWFMSQLAVPNAFLGFLFGPFYQCIAVSATPDPMGPYYRYQFSFSKLNDYPKFGLWPDAYYMTANQFSAITLKWAGQSVVAFDRDRMLSGQPASMVYFDLASVDMNLGGMLPSHLVGAAPPVGSPAYFMEVDDDAWGYSPDQLQLWQFHVDWAHPASSTFAAPVKLPTAPFDSDMCGYASTCIPQPGTTAKIDTLSDRLMYRLLYRNFGTHESLVLNHTVDVDGSDHAGIRWYEVRSPRSAPAIYQQGTYAPDADHRWMGSIAMDRAGDIALGFSVSGTTTSPSIRYTGRLATDPPGLMTQGEADIMVGSGSQTHESGRWGDYSLMAVDPADQCTFWYTQEYYASTSLAGWHTRVGSFAWPSCMPASNLPRVTVAATTATAREAGLVNGAFTVTRSGDLSAPLDVHYTLSGTATPGTDYVTLPGTVTIAAGDSAATIVVTPVDDLLVEPNETVVISLLGDAAYLTGSPSSAIVTIVSDDVPPDLIVSAVAAPAVAGAGVAITVTDTTKNQGNGPSDASATGLYLSTNTLLDSADLPLGTRSVPPLAAGASSVGPVTVTIPASTATGTYYVLGKADAINAIVETQETNNTRTSTAVRIGPDLIVAAVTVPPIGGAGGTVIVGDTTKNQGGGVVDAPPSSTAFYLSTNAIWEVSDRLLGARPVPVLASGASDTAAATSLQIPQDTATGSYFLIVKADANGAVVESLETNNTMLGSIRIGPDLTVSALSVSGSVPAGGSVTVTDTTRNGGGGSAGASTTRFYVSTNGAVDASDTMICNRNVSPLAAGTSEMGSTVCTVPAGMPAGTFYLIGVADSGNAVTETTETNNNAIAIIRITS